MISNHYCFNRRLYFFIIFTIKSCVTANSKYSEYYLTYSTQRNLQSNKLFFSKAQNMILAHSGSKANTSVWARFISIYDEVG